MLVELVVENYAVVERLRVRFYPGLNLLTGETGSGKSLVVDALGLLFGVRATTDAIRTGAERARISGIFDISGMDPLRPILEAAGVETEDGELLIEREILAGGKSRAFAGSRPVTAALLRDMAPHLGDIHGQHDQQQLFSTDAQLEMLDSFAGVDKLLSAVGETFRGWRDCTEQLGSLERSEQEKARLTDLWSFQVGEIEAAAPTAGEDESLERERRVLQNLVRLQEGSSTAYAALYDSEDSALALVLKAARQMEEISRFDPSLETVRASLKPAEIAIEEASFAVRDYLSRLEANPDRLEEIEFRLEALDKLKRKYGGTIEEVLRFAEGLRKQLEALENEGERRQILKKKLAELADRYRQIAGELNTRRSAAARKLEKQVVKELATLAMDRTVFRIVISPSDWSERGADALVFLVSANVGEEPRPLDKVASGGEISRLALALKTCVSSAAGGGKQREAAEVSRTLVFDEVDAGIGGRAAETVGRRLQQLAATNQVICVTHLPQIAGFADHHFFVEKTEVNGRARATIQELAADERTREIGRMLSGERMTPEALKHAEKLIRLSAPAKS